MTSEHAAIPIVELRQVRKSYGDVAALAGLDLRVDAGKVYGFLGRNGAGKSTTLRIVMGITRPDAGEISLFGRTGAALRPSSKFRQRIGYVAQEQNFYAWMTPLRLGEFLAGFFPTWDAQEYQRLLTLLELPPKRPIGTFSGGMQAKTALAAALAHRPELLVLDEPTAGMDAVTRREFLSLVREQARQSGRATLFSSHLIDEVELAADTIGIVDHGQMAWQGPLADLRACTRALISEGPFAKDQPAPALPEGIHVLEDRSEGDRRTLIVAGPPDRMNVDLQNVAGWTVAPAPLVDVFVAMVGKRLAY
ncbi:MAG TPA: ABC transporter ATP-binding protein [Polyangia bacterium]